MCGWECGVCGEGWCVGECAKGVCRVCVDGSVGCVWMGVEGCV